MPKLANKEYKEQVKNHETNRTLANGKVLENAGSSAALFKKTDAGLADHLKQTQDYGAVRDIISEKLDALLSMEMPYVQNWEQRKYIMDGSYLRLNPGIKDVECTIAVVAPVSAGKSTLLNAICEYPILPAASNVLSSVPTYIRRAKEHGSEMVTVYPIYKMSNENDKENEKYVRDERNRKTYAASDISKALFNDLFSYMLLVMRGNGTEFGTTIENIVYFMASTEAVDDEWYGWAEDKMSLSDDAFQLSYENPRHRLMLLLILTCVYVKQNESNENKSEYWKAVNAKRIGLMKKCGFPAESDYCVDLEWCSSSIPDGVTLIDLPGTGSSTKEKDGQSSHTQFVKGILFDADAVWVLSSEDGTVHPDLLDAITDAIDADKNKNRVCIYNCKNGDPNNPKGVSDFMEMLPCLVGERCFVVNALAGEYKYTQNGIKAENTKTASERRHKDNALEDAAAEADKVIQNLSKAYCDATKAMPTYTSRLENGVVVVRQERNPSYTLETFFKVALTDYVDRLKYEIILKKAIKQLNFFKLIKEDLASTLKLFISISGRGPEIAGAVNDATENAYLFAIRDYTTATVTWQTKIVDELKPLSSQLGGTLKTAFAADYKSLIEEIHKEWKTLITAGNDNTMETNWLGNYSLRAGHSNWSKFSMVRDHVDAMISINAFHKALEEADKEIEKFRELLDDYINKLKNITENFCNDYANKFSIEYDNQRNGICCDANGKVINDTLSENFRVAKTQLESAISGKLGNLRDMLCGSFVVLTDQGGPFDQVVEKTNKEFKKRLSDQVLDGLRADIRKKFSATNERFLMIDRLDRTKFNNIISDNFKDVEQKCKDNLDKMVNALYGDNLLDKKTEEQFPQSLSAMLKDFNSDTIGGAEERIGQMHQNISDLIGFSAGVASNVNIQIAEVKTAISDWDTLYQVFQDICIYLIWDESGIIHELTDEYCDTVNNDLASVNADK